MIFVKLAVLFWVAYLIVRWFVKSNITLKERIMVAARKKLKMTFGRWVAVILCLLALVDSFAAFVWFLFFR